MFEVRIVMFSLGGLFIIVHRVVQSKQVRGNASVELYNYQVTYIAFVMYHTFNRSRNSE
jgi:hypothetical protein